MHEGEASFPALLPVFLCLHELDVYVYIQDGYGWQACSGNITPYLHDSPNCIYPSISRLQWGNYYNLIFAWSSAVVAEKDLSFFMASGGGRIVIIKVQ